MVFSPLVRCEVSQELTVNVHRSNCLEVPVGRLASDTEKALRNC